MKVRYFLQPHKAPPLRRILLVESGSRHLLERLIPNLHHVFGEHLRFDICTCFPGQPRAIDAANTTVYRTSDYTTGIARRGLYSELASNGYDAVGIICSAEPIMTKWKWMLAHRVPARVFLLNENADYVWFDRLHTQVLFAYARTRMGFEGTGAVRTLARIVLLPLTLIYLLFYASYVHARRALRLLVW